MVTKTAEMDQMKKIVIIGHVNQIENSVVIMENVSPSNGTVT